MSIDVRFKKLDHSDSLVQYMDERIEKIKIFCRGDVSFHFDVSMQGKLKRVDLNINYRGHNFYGKAMSADYYVSVDMAVNKVMKQVKKHREKIKVHRNYAYNPVESEVA